MDRIDPTFAISAAVFLLGFWIFSVVIDLRRKKLERDLARLLGPNWQIEKAEELWPDGKYRPIRLSTLELWIKELKETNDEPRTNPR